MKPSKWIDKHTKSLLGKRVAVTGSTGGLGRELCSYLASLGASLVLLDRNRERSDAHKRSLTERFGLTEITCISLDLEDLVSASRAVERLAEMEIDLFIHNAGAYSIPRHKCKSGYDNVFQINFATPYYMICRLLPVLRKREGRVVVVGSIAHRYSEIDPTDVDFSKRRSAAKVYGNAKRYLMFSLFSLIKTERKASLAVVHPGITPTNITSHYPKPIYAIIKYPMRLIFMSPKKAALSILQGVFEQTADAEWIGPSFLNIWGMPRKKKLTSCTADERARISETAARVDRQCRDAIRQEMGEII